MEPSTSIDQKIKELGDWRGKTLAQVRDLMHAADPKIVEEWKWAKRHRKECRFSRTWWNGRGRPSPIIISWRAGAGAC